MSDDIFGLKPMREGQKQLREDAEHIYTGWKNKRYRIDSDKAVKTAVAMRNTRFEKNWLGREVRKERIEQTNIAIVFTNAITDYERDRGSPYDWTYAAESLTRAYHAAETHDCLIDSPEEQIRKLKVSTEDLTTKLKESNKRADKFEKRFQKTNDALIAIHNKLGEREKELSDILQKDIKSSFDNNTSGVLQGKFGDDDM